MNKQDGPTRRDQPTARIDSRGTEDQQRDGTQTSRFRRRFSYHWCEYHGDDTKVGIVARTSRVEWTSTISVKTESNLIYFLFAKQDEYY